MIRRVSVLDTGIFSINIVDSCCHLNLIIFIKIIE